MNSRTDNPLADFDQWENEQEKWLRKRPKCDCCGRPITDDYCFEMGGDIICEECLNKAFRKWTEDFE